MKATLLLLAFGLLSLLLPAYGQSTPASSDSLLTLTDGRYLEIFHVDTARRIGRYTYNTVTRRAYRIGFNGKENNCENHRVVQTSCDHEYRTHNPRAGRFLSLDPLTAKYPHNSPYAFSENRVIDAIELEGLEGFVLGTSNPMTPAWYDGKPDGDINGDGNIDPQERAAVMKVFGATVGITLLGVVAAPYVATVAALPASQMVPFVATSAYLNAPTVAVVLEAGVLLSLGDQAPPIPLLAAEQYMVAEATATINGVERLDVQLARATAQNQAAAAMPGGRGGVAAGLSVEGQTFTGTSTRAGGGALNPAVQEAYDAVPANLRPPYHGKCAEGRALSAALEAGVNPAGGTMYPARIGGTSPGQFVTPCPSCAHVLKNFDVITGTPLQ